MNKIRDVVLKIFSMARVNKQIKLFMMEIGEEPLVTVHGHSILRLDSVRHLKP